MHYKLLQRMEEALLLFKPKDEEFYELFTESTQILRQGAKVLKTALQDHSKVEDHMALITEIEHRADDLNDAIIDKLNRTFITPLDREDIYSLATMLDDVADFLQGTVERMMLYRTGKPSSGAMEMAEILSESIEELVAVFGLLKNIRGNQHKILDHSRKIVDMESEGDRIYRREVAQLFATCSDPIEVIKWKEVLEHLEGAIDHCEKIADLLRGVVLKYA